MSNKLALKAQSVLDDALNHPECIVSRAMYIVGSYARHRILVQRLWEWGDLLRLYRKTRRTSTERNYVRRGAMAAKAIRASIRDNGYPITAENFHDAMNTLRWARRAGLELEQFRAAIQTLESCEVETMFRYLSCANAERHDDTLTPVKFLRWLPLSWRAEIMAWRLANQKAPSIVLPSTQIHGFNIADLKAVAEALSGGYESSHSGHESTAGFAARFIRAVIANAESGSIQVGTMTAGNVTNVVIPPGTNLTLKF